MEIRIRLGGPELARVRFAMSPAYETVTALRVLRQPGVHAVHVPWVRWARPRVTALPDLALLRALVAHDRYTPAFLIPPPSTRLPDLDAELRRIRATPTALVHRNIERLMPRSTLIRTLHDDPRGGLRRVAEALRHLYDAIVAPHWPRISRVLEADITHRAGILVAGGVATLFAGLHPEVRWTDGELLLYPGQPDGTAVALGGHGLVLCPSVFCWPRVTAAIRPVAEGTLRYPARGVATLWEFREPAPDALAALIGRTRAGMLAALAAPATTTELAATLAVTPGAVSQHLAVLRAAGLVTTRRDGRTVLHLRTARAETLLA
ncbi:DUF5937 family protein [Dactylosporangium fulvum]|uniref:DUF5937 family protein n=1 Tax=Dactylosporangium fulvum TaxID=53359 RepID=A0ABY5VZE6_9ACTN|nr:DUF5937 family protein [Dactylosporangium fulvum]UWP83152.1 DUF5937 family protein [Dactylosporangium fulvum]